MKIDIGSPAPAFTLDDINEQAVQLSDFSGSRVLLSWHPAAWTGVCTDQMRALERHYDAFKALKTAPLGLSVDSSPCKKAWAAVLGLNNLQLLCDFWPHGRAAKDYGIFIEDFGMSQRANIIIDENGIVRWFKQYELGELPDIDEVLRALENLDS